MIFNYKKILSIFFLIVGLFLLFSYVTIPMMGIGSTFIEIFGWMLSINKLQKQLTPEYIEYTRVTKWNGAYPSTMLGNSSGVLLNVNK